MLQTQIIKGAEFDSIILKGRLDAAGAVEFEKSILSFDQNKKNALIDFTDVEYLSSAGIRGVLRLQKALIKRGGQIYIAGIRTEVKAVLDMTGLSDYFKYFDTSHQAEKYLSVSYQSNSFKKKSISGGDLLIYQNTGAISYIDIYGTFDTAEIKPPKKITLEKSGFSFGLGSLNFYSPDKAESAGEFCSLFNCAGVISSDSHNIPDFITTKSPADTNIYLQNAIAINGISALEIEYSGITTQFSTLIEDIISLKNNPTISELNTKIIGIIGIGSFVDLKGKYYSDLEALKNNNHSTSAKKPEKSNIFHNTIHGGLTISQTEKEGIPVFFIGVAAYSNKVNSIMEDDKTGFIDSLLKNQINGNICFHGHCISFNNTEYKELEKYSLEDIIKYSRDIEKLDGVYHFDSSSELHTMKAWIYYPRSVRIGGKTEKNIEIEQGIPFKEEWREIVSLLFPAASKIILSPLSADSFSAIFRVVCFDEKGRKLLPEAVRFCTEESCRAEIEAYKNFVEQFIFDNCPQITGAAYSGGWGGVLYKFSGIAHGESKLKKFESFFNSNTKNEIIQKIDLLFTEILKSWYAQPKWTVFHPYIEHNPLKFFPELYDAAKQEFGISPDIINIKCSETGLEYPNPFYFIKYEFPKRKKIEYSWYTSINHGNISINNIFLDEHNNIFLLDFSRCSEKNAVTDFARIEASALIELSNIENDFDIKNLLDFFDNLIQIQSNKTIPEFLYKGTDKKIEKIFAIICVVRKYAGIITLFEKSSVPYFLTLFEALFSYILHPNLSLLKKKCAVYAAGIIVKRIEKSQN